MDEDEVVDDDEIRVVVVVDEDEVVIDDEIRVVVVE